MYVWPICSRDKREFHYRWKCRRLISAGVFFLSHTKSCYSRVVIGIMTHAATIYLLLVRRLVICCWLYYHQTSILAWDSSCLFLSFSIFIDNGQHEDKPLNLEVCYLLVFTIIWGARITTTRNKRSAKSMAGKARNKDPQSLKFKNMGSQTST